MGNLSVMFQQFINGLTIGGVYAMVAVGLTLVFGILRQMNWAHGELYMLAGYALVITYTMMNVPYYLAVILTVLIVAFVGLLYEWLVFRPVRGKPFVNAIVCSLGVSIFVWNIVLALFGGTPYKLATPLTGKIMRLGLFSISGQRLMTLIVGVVIIGAVYYWIQNTRAGRAMRAVEQDAEAARLMGVNINRIAEVTFAIGGGLAGLAGALVGPIFVIEPGVGAWAVGKAFAVVVMGGMGSVMGSIFAGFALGVIESLAIGFLATQYRDLIAYLMIIVILWLRPQGLFGRIAQKGA